MNVAAVMEVKKEEETDLAENLEDEDICDIQCFYCLDIFCVSDSFVLCEVCEGFVACLSCWHGHNLSLLELEKRKVKLLRRDQRRENKFWPLLHDHSFSMKHADWTDEDKGDFREGTYRELHRLRIEGANNKENAGVKRKGLNSSMSTINRDLSDGRRKSTKRSNASPYASFSQPFFRKLATKLAPATESASNSSQPITKAAAQMLVGLAAATSLIPPPAITSTQTLVPTHRSLYMFHQQLLRFYATHPIAHTSSIEVRVSHHVPSIVGQPCQLGVFATKAIKAGEDICYYASHWMHMDDAKHLKPEQKSWIRRAPDTGGVLDGAPTAKLFKRQIPMSPVGVQQLKALKASDLIIGSSKHSPWPIGCMINSCIGARLGEQNVEVEHVNVKQGQGIPEGSYVKLKARLDIEVGTELLSRYKSFEESKWKHQ